jgi:tRNA-uridine 2-sulfurtransferase
VRYRSQPVPARLVKKTADHFELHFPEPQFAVSPGQSVVLYDGARLLGGGFIRERLATATALAAPTPAAHGQQSGHSV